MTQETNSESTVIQQREIALALSGGGMRAMVFHLGVLSYLAEKNLLERIRYISTVSGGTLLAGLIFHHNNLQWPSSVQFRDNVAKAVRTSLTDTDIQCEALLRLLLPCNWRYIPFRANVLADTIRSGWGIKATLNDLPPSPIWAVNATTVETGRRWRFRASPNSRALGRQTMGDGVLGYSYDQALPLASAMATSAAFPGGISPLVLKTKGRKWFLPNFADPTKPDLNIQPQFRSYHLADGGVYDNLGLEPIFDHGENILRPGTNCNYIISSDAGAPLNVQKWGFLSQLLGFSLRTVNIMGAQQRNLRVRSLVNAFEKNRVKGIFINIAEPAREAINGARSSKPQVCANLEKLEWLTIEKALKGANFKTTLRSPPAEMMKLIERHGYETAKLQMELWG